MENKEKQRVKRGKSVYNSFAASGSLITVSEASKKLGCSDRRVRTLLSQGRLLGEYDRSSLRWWVNFPFHLVHGKRGPKLGSVPKDGQRHPARSSSARTECRSPRPEAGKEA